MPIYEYECAACNHRLEALQKISDIPLIDCPACSQPSLARLISAAGFRLGGSGWYETDFKNKNKRNLKENTTGDAAKPASSPDTGKSKAATTTS